MLARNAPTAAVNMLVAMRFLGPNLSDTIPLGTLSRNWMRLGIATMRPTCWLVRANSSLRTGKRVVRMFPAAWTNMWVSTMMRRLPLIKLLQLFFSFSPISTTDETHYDVILLFTFSCSHGSFRATKCVHSLSHGGRSLPLTLSKCNHTFSSTLFSAHQSKPSDNQHHRQCHEKEE